MLIHLPERLLLFVESNANTMDKAGPEVLYLVVLALKLEFNLKSKFILSLLPTKIVKLSGLAIDLLPSYLCGYTVYRWEPTHTDY